MRCAPAFFIEKKNIGDRSEWHLLKSIMSSRAIARRSSTLIKPAAEEIADQFDVHYSTVSRAIKYVEEQDA